MKSNKCYETLNEREDILNYLILNSIKETNLFRVSWISLYKCNYLFKSIIALLKKGFIESFRALFRQAYEFILIAKVCSDIPYTIIEKEFFIERDNTNKNNKYYLF